MINIFSSPAFANILSIVALMIAMGSIFYTHRMYSVEKNRDKEDREKQLTATLGYNLQKNIHDDPEIIISNTGAHSAIITKIEINGKHFTENPLVTDKKNIDTIPPQSSVSIRFLIFSTDDWPESFHIEWVDGTLFPKEFTMPIKF